MADLFRGMKEDSDGLPVLAPTARGLGVRPGIDVPAQQCDEVVQPGQGGLSVSPDDPLNLPRYRRPPEFQGDGKDPVWTLADSDLPSELRYRADPDQPGHGFLEPSRPMPLSEYERAVAGTRKQWRKVSLPPVRSASDDD